MSDMGISGRSLAYSTCRNVGKVYSGVDIVDAEATGRESRRTAKRERYYTVTYLYFYKKEICL